MRTPRGSSVYRCQQCGFASAKPGTCPDCKRSTGELVPLGQLPTAPSGPGAVSQAPAQPTPSEKIDTSAKTEKTEKTEKVDKPSET